LFKVYGDDRLREKIVQESVKLKNYAKTKRRILHIRGRGRPG
jgi:hypothetical protein